VTPWINNGGKIWRTLGCGGRGAHEDGRKRSSQVDLSRGTPQSDAMEDCEKLIDVCPFLRSVEKREILALIDAVKNLDKISDVSILALTLHRLRLSDWSIPLSAAVSRVGNSANRGERRLHGRYFRMVDTAST